MLSAARTVAPVSCRPLQPASTVLHHQRKRTGGIALCQAVAETITQCITSSDVIDVEFLGQEQDGRLTVRGTMELPSSASSTYAAVTDHGRAPEIFSNIVSSTATPIVRFFTVHGPVLALLNAELDPTAAAHRQDVWRMLRKFMLEQKWLHTNMQDGKMEVSQQCTWKFLMFRGSFKIVLNVDEQPATREVEFSLLESKFMRAFQGSWNIQEMPGGGCKVEHTLQVTPLISPPPAFAGYTSRIFIKQVTGIMEDLQQALKQ